MEVIIEDVADPRIVSPRTGGPLRIVGSVHPQREIQPLRAKAAPIGGHVDATLFVATEAGHHRLRKQLSELILRIHPAAVLDERVDTRSSPIGDECVHPLVRLCPLQKRVAIGRNMVERVRAEVRSKTLLEPPREIGEGLGSGIDYRQAISICAPARKHQCREGDSLHPAADDEIVDVSFVHGRSSPGGLPRRGYNLKYPQPPSVGVRRIGASAA